MNEERVDLNKWVLWIFGIFVSVIILGGGGWASIIHGRLNEMDARDRMRSEQVYRANAIVDQVAPRMDRIETKQDRIETKIDSLDLKVDTALRRK